jgi:hypothetical protein
MKEKNNKDEQQDARSSENANDTPIYLTGDSTLQTPEEDEHDKSSGTADDDTIDVSNDDLHDTNADRMAGSDRAGTSERKP